MKKTFVRIIMVTLLGLASASPGSVPMVVSPYRSAIHGLALRSKVVSGEGLG